MITTIVFMEVDRDTPEVATNMLRILNDSIGFARPDTSIWRLLTLKVAET